MLCSTAVLCSGIQDALPRADHTQRGDQQAQSHHRGVADQLVRESHVPCRQPSLTAPCQDASPHIDMFSRTPCSKSVVLPVCSPSNIKSLEEEEEKETLKPPIVYYLIRFVCHLAKCCYLWQLVRAVFLYWQVATTQHACKIALNACP